MQEDTMKNGMSYIPAEWLLLFHRMTAWTRGVIFFFAAMIGMWSPAFSGEYQFEYIGVADGLSSNSITNIFQDRRGFLWFGTLEGLNRYDGYTFTIFRHDVQDSTSLGSNRTLSIYEDRSGSLWVGTEDAGLNRYDQAAGRFYHYTNLPSNPKSLSNNQVESIIEDRSGTLWIGTKNGLNRLDRKTGVFSRYFSNPADSSSLFHNHIGAMMEDSDGVLWIAGGECLHRFNAESGTFTRFRPQVPLSKGEPIIGSIVEEPRGTLWISTWGSGLWKFEKATGAFTVFLHDPGNPGSLCKNEVGHLGVDGSGNLWIGTADGLDMLRKGSGEFTHFYHDVVDQSSISANGIWPIFRDRSSVLWIGTYRGGLNKLVPSRMIFSFHANDPKNPNSLSYNSVFSVYESRDNALWIGTAHGLNRFDRNTGVFTVYYARAGGLSSDYINVVLEDAAGIFWIGTNGGGLNRFDPRNKQFRTYRSNSKDPHTLNNDWVYRIISDDDGKLLIGTQSGVSRFDPATGQFLNLSAISGDTACTALYLDKAGIIWAGSNAGLIRYDSKGGKTTRFVSSPHDSTTLSNDYIRSINEDPSGNIWIGTLGGLNRFDRASGRFTRYTSRHGLVNETINDIEGDHYGHIWVCTNAGISRLNPLTGEIRNYGFQNGLPFRVFDESCLMKMKNGEFVIGGQEGFFMFRPENFQSGGQEPPVAITGFRIFNDEVKLDRPIWEKKKIVLTHHDGFFSFEFAALDYTAPDHNQYAYRMEGFDRHWNYSENRRYASYTNLHPGKYIFRVKAANGNGVWNERGAAIEVIIQPPFWETWWFRGLCILSLLGIVYGIHMVRVMVFKQQKKLLETLVTERTLELEEKKNQLEQSERMYRNLVDTSPDAILIAELSGIVRMANPRVAGMLGAESVEALLDHNFMDFLQPRERDHFRTLWENLLDKGVLQNVFLSIGRLSGSSLSVEWNASLILDRGQPRIMGVFRDITEMKRIEEERVERERMRGVLETAGGICHELNQPLQIVTGYAEIMEMANGRSDTEKADIVRKIRQEVKRMAEITRKLSNITAYRTKAYTGGTRIIDLSRSSDKGTHNRDESRKISENREEQS